MIRAAIAVLALLIIVGGVIGGVYFWNKQKEPEVASAPGSGPNVALDNETLEVPNTEGPLDLAPVMSTDDAVSAPAGPELSGEVLVAVGEETAPVDLSDSPPVPGSGTDRDITTGTVTSENQRTPRPENNRQPPAAPTAGLLPVEVTPVPPTPIPTPVPTSTPIPTTPVVTPTPVSPPAMTPTPAVPAGNYSVYTFVPVLESKLATVRDVMKPLGVLLKEEKAGQQKLQAYRVAVGYFVTKEQAESWARTNFKPKGVKYYVYPAQGMYSIQVGVFSNQQNVDKQIRELYQKFPGWRLPIRTEVTTIGQSTYNLSIRRIPENLARKVQNELVRLGIQAQLSGI